LKIPEMTSSGRVFRLRGHGMPAIGKPAERGDLYVTVDIQIPSHLTPEERQHYEALRTIEEYLKTPSEQPKAFKMVERAVAESGRDNCTAVIVEFAP